MSITTKARELGEAIVASQPYQDLRESESAIELNPIASAMIKSYQDKREEIQNLMAQEGAQQGIQQRVAELRNIEQAMQKLPEIIRMTQAQQEMQNMMNQVNAILRFYITGETEDAGCAGGSCSSCSGCEGHHH